LQVLTATNRSWLFRYTLDKKAHWIGLGALADVTLDQARAEAFKAKQQGRAGSCRLTREPKTVPMQKSECTITCHTIGRVHTSFLN